MKKQLLLLVSLVSLVALGASTYTLDTMTGLQFLGTQASISASAIDWAAGTHFYKTIAANTTFTFANAADTLCIVVVVTGDASHTVTWPAAVKWVAATAPTQTLSQPDVYTFIQVNGVIYGTAVQNVH